MASDSCGAGARLTACLRDLERRAGARAATLRAADARSAGRRGLLCGLAEHRLLVPLERLLGILPLPRTLTAVPGTARWMLGIANHHGKLLPLYDLRGLLLAQFKGNQRRGIALVVPGAARPFGVTVDSVLGLRRVQWRTTASSGDDLPDALLATLIGYCDVEQDRIPVVDPARIEQLPELSAGVATTVLGGPG
jgi:chemotaxis signal transduction protein